jgi:glycosyltransferase involved in cell wall biosynthesis
MAKSKKIVFIGFLPGFGGAEKSMIMTANGLSKLGNDVTVISLKDNNVVYEIDKQVKYIFIPDHKGKKIRKQLNRFLDLKNKLAEIKPDIVISFWLQPAIFAAVLSKFIGFKVIYSERGDPTDEEYKGFLGVLRYIFFKLIDRFVFQTQGAKQCFSKSVQDKSVVINNPVYIKYNNYNIPQKRRKVIVNVGRLHKQKNQKLLINAFAKISDTFPEYTLEIYGDGELKVNLEKQIEQLNLKNRVILKGTTKHLFDEIMDASLFVLSSDYEGMPNALMEAMALGIPCISTDCKPGGARELITDGKNGLITKRGSVDNLAQAMKYMLENPEDAEIMGRNAKQICNTHSVDNIIKMWDEYITGIIGGNSKN